MRITIGKFDEAGEPVWFDVETDELKGGDNNEDTCETAVV